MCKPISNLPRTHYDLALRKTPDMLGYLRKDLTRIAEKRLHGPFDGDMEFAHPIDNYMSHMTATLLKTAQDIAERDLGVSRDDPEWELSRLLARDPGLLLILQTKFSEYITILNFELFGKKTFHISDNLVEHLALTELDIEADFVRLPFESCLFVYTSPTAIEALNRICEESPLPLSVPISVFLMTLPAAGNAHMIRIVAFQSDPQASHAMIKRDLLIKPDWVIENLLTTDWEKLKETDPEIKASFSAEDNILSGFGGRTEPGGLAKTSDAHFYTKGLPFFRIVVNTILYLVSNDPDVVQHLSPHHSLADRLQKVKSYKKRRAIQREKNRSSALDFNLVGGTIGQIHVQKPSNTPQPDKDPINARKYASRFIVRGHWRNQPYGEKFAKRKLKWIPPYWKGPDMGQLISRPYVVD
jgi:hypothetical protein